MLLVESMTDSVDMLSEAGFTSVGSAIGVFTSTPSSLGMSGCTDSADSTPTTGTTGTTGSITTGTTGGCGDVDVEDRVSLGEEEASSDWLGEEGFSVFSSVLVSITSASSAVLSIDFYTTG